MRQSIMKYKNVYNWSNNIFKDSFININANIKTEYVLFAG